MGLIVEHRKVLVTGAAGHIGVRLAEYLSTNDAGMLRLAVHHTSPPLLSTLGDVITGDLRDLDFCSDAVNGCDTVLHLASVPTHVEDEATAVETQESMMANLLDASQSMGVTRFVHLSSIHVYGSNLQGRVDETTPCDPITPYGKAHLRSEELAQRDPPAELSRLSLRCGNGFGASRSTSTSPWSLVTTDLCRQAVQDSVLRLSTHGRHRRDFVTISDIVRAIHHFGFDSTANGVVLLGSGHSLILRELAWLIAERAARMFGRTYDVEWNTSDVSPAVEYQLNLRRLHENGFQPANDFDTEIDGLLRAAVDREGTPT
jgi:UDP-glucose 4-epimerase